VYSLLVQLHSWSHATPLERFQ